MTPEEKLCSRSWRLRNSAGLLWSIFSLGLLTGVGFLIRGVKAKNRLWIGLGIGFLVVGIGVFATAGVNEGTKDAPVTTTASTIWGWVWFTSFVAGVVTAFITNKKWLIWKAHDKDVKWYAQAGASQPTAASSPVHGYDPSAAAPAFEPQTAPPMTAPSPAPAGALDVNSASAPELSAVLGVDSEMANRILAARQSLGSFTSFEQLMSKAQVPPHLLIPHRAKMTFGAPANAPAPQPEPPSTGSKSGRKLFD
ncbi:helix-hairpin-helix domain-containing protein [Arthrobacter sp. MPF02]|uniref:helix-hairpin-helix domain-containing protein n=1 Tax=Arthrobacter sp. MPF02 TaxID=3388492 RepID=UPI003984D4A6